MVTALYERDRTLYAVLTDVIGGVLSAYNQDTSAWVAWTAITTAQWTSDYLIYPMTESDDSDSIGSGIYSATVPDGSTANATVLIYEQIGASPDKQYDVILGDDVLAATRTAAEAVQTQVGTAGAGLTSIGDARLANLDAKVSTRALASDLVLMSGFVELLAEGINEVKEAAEAAKTNTDPLATMIADGAFTEAAIGNVVGAGPSITTKQTNVVVRD